jgi:hypothetical protein
MKAKNNMMMMKRKRRRAIQQDAYLEEYGYPK